MLRSLNIKSPGVQSKVSSRDRANGSRATDETVGEETESRACQRPLFKTGQHSQLTDERSRGNVSSVQPSTESNVQTQTNPKAKFYLPHSSEK